MMYHRCEWFSDVQLSGVTNKRIGIFLFLGFIDAIA